MAEHPDNPAHPQWRLVRAKLPPYGERVLVAYRSTNSNWRGTMIGARSHTNKTGEHWKNDFESDVPENAYVYAWMPLPVPGVEE